MEKRFLEFCEKQDLFTPHRRVLVALSGGLDSMNLYELLYKNKERLKIHLVLAHVNHGQRPESDLEESELRALGERHVSMWLTIRVILQKQKLVPFVMIF